MSEILEIETGTLVNGLWSCSPGSSYATTAESLAAWRAAKTLLTEGQGVREHYHRDGAPCLVNEARHDGQKVVEPRKTLEEYFDCIASPGPIEAPDDQTIKERKTQEAAIVDAKLGI